MFKNPIQACPSELNYIKLNVTYGNTQGSPVGSAQFSSARPPTPNACVIYLWLLSVISQFINMTVKANDWIFNR